MELLKSTLRQECVFACESAEALVEGELQLPEEAKLLTVLARVMPGTAEVMQNRVDVEGVVSFCALYELEGAAGSAEEGLNFMHTLRVEGATPMMKADFVAASKQVEYEQQGTRIKVSAIVSFEVAIEHQGEVSFVKGFSGHAAQTLPRDITALCKVDEGGAHIMLREETMLPARMPAARTILRVNAHSSQVTAISSMGQVQVAGEIMVEVLYAGQENQEPIGCHRLVIPYSEAVSVSSAMMGMPASASAVIQAVNASIDDAEGSQMRTVSIECMLNLSATVLENVESTVLSDAYIPGKQLTLTYTKLLLKRSPNTVTLEHAVREPLPLPEGAPPLARSLWLNAAPFITEVAHNGNIEISGICECTLMYRCEENNLHCFKSEIPFTVSAPRAGLEAPFRVGVTVDQSEASQISPTEAEAIFTLRITIMESPNTSTEIIVDADEGEEQEALKGLMLHFVQPGDTLWLIARNYQMSISDIRRINPFVEDEVAPGQKLVLYQMMKS